MGPISYEFKTRFAREYMTLFQETGPTKSGSPPDVFLTARIANMPRCSSIGYRDADSALGCYVSESHAPHDLENVLDRIGEYGIQPQVYVAGPYTAIDDVENNFQTTATNVKVAKAHAKVLRELGFAVICPHSNTDGDTCSWDDAMVEAYTHILKCDAIFLLPKWELSEGSVQEREWAEELGIPIFEADKLSTLDLANLSQSDIEYHASFDGTANQISKEFFGKKSVWNRCPQQVHGFIKIIMNMFRVHIRKNEDYSPHNILGTGEVGLATRFWDKCARLMNLSGFDIASGQLDVPQQPKNESIEDNLEDAGNYSIIWRLFRMGIWGR